MVLHSINDPKFERHFNNRKKELAKKFGVYSPVVYLADVVGQLVPDGQLLPVGHLVPVGQLRLVI